MSLVSNFRVIGCINEQILRKKNGLLKQRKILQSVWCRPALRIADETKSSLLTTFLPE